MFKTISKLFRSGTDVVAAKTKIDAMSFIYGVLALIVIVGPFLFIPASGLSVAAGKGFLMLLLGIIMVFIYGVHVLRQGEITIPYQGIFWFLLVIIIGGFAGSLFAPSFATALSGYGFETTTWTFMAMFVVVVFFARLVITNQDRLVVLYAGMFIATLVTMLFHVTRFIFGPAVASMGVLTTPLATLVGSWSDLGILLGLMIIIAMITLELVALRSVIKWVVGIIGGLAVVLLTVMNIKIIWIIVGLMALLITLYLFSFAYWDPQEKTYSKKSRIPGYSLAVLAIAVVALFFGGFANGFASRHQNLAFNDIRPSIVATVQVAGKSIWRNPVTGYGPNLFAAPWTLVKPAALSGTPVGGADFQNGFGYIPGQMATNGVTGIIGWGGFIILLIMALWKKMSRGFSNPFDRYITVSLGFLVIYLGVMVSVYVPGNYILIIFAIFTGSFLALDDAKNKTFSFIRDPRTSFFGIIAIMALLIVAALGGYVGVRKMVSWVHYHRGTVLLQSNDIAGATQKFNTAAAFASLDIYHNQLAGIGIYQLNKIISDNAVDKEALSQQAQQMLGAILGHAQAAVAANPSSYKNWILLGDTYRTMVTLGVTDAYDRAIEAYQEATKRNPNDATMVLSLAQLDLANNKTDGALEFIRQSIEKYPTSRAYIIRAQIELSKNETTAAIASLDTAVQLDPSNATLAYQYGLLLFTEKRYDSAIVAFQRAILADRSYGPAYVYLGVSYERSGNMTDAEKVYEFVKKQFSDGVDAIEQVKSGVVDEPTPQEAAPDVAPEPKKVAPTPKKQ